MFDSHATVHETMRLQTTYSAGEPVSLMLPTTPTRPVVIEVIINGVTSLTFWGHVTSTVKTYVTVVCQHISVCNLHLKTLDGTKMKIR